MRPAPVIRAASRDETDAVVALCRRLDNRDYAQQSWSEWVEAYPDLSLVAELNGRVIGCVRASVEFPGCAFAQALRVDATFRRMGVATALMQELLSRLSAAGIRRVLGVTGADNVPARRFHPTLGLREVGAIARRRHPAWGRPALPVQPLEESVAAALAGREGLLVSRPGLAHFHRIYFRASGEWLRARARNGLLVAARDGGWALLDPPGASGAWIAAFKQSTVQFAELADVGVQLAGRQVVTFEAPADPLTQACLTGLGFEAPGPTDRYVVLEAAIPL